MLNHKSTKSLVIRILIFFLENILKKPYYSCFTMSENIIDFLLCTMIYLSYVNLTIQLSQFAE